MYFLCYFAWKYKISLDVYLSHYCMSVASLTLLYACGMINHISFYEMKNVPLICNSLMGINYHWYDIGQGYNPIYMYCSYVGLEGTIWPSLSPCTVINPILLTYLLTWGYTCIVKLIYRDHSWKWSSMHRRGPCLSRLPWIFPAAPSGATGNIQGNLTALAVSHTK